MENRKYNRILLGMHIELSDLDIEAKNISEGGVCIVTNDPLEINKNYKLRFKLPKIKKYVETIGKVVWTKYNGKDILTLKDLYDNGIKFLDMDEENLNIIKEYMIEE